MVPAQRPLHGQASLVEHHQTGLFVNLNSPLSVARYHSLILSKNNFPAVLSISASSEEGEIMAIQHQKYPIFGVQFHPESILSPQGHDLLKQFLTT